MELGELALRIAERIGVEHAEVRYQRFERAAMNLRGRKLTGVVEGVDEGIGVRVIVNGCWGFSYTHNLVEEEIEKTVKRAVKLAKIQGGGCGVKLAEAELTKGKFQFDYKVDPRNVDLSDKISILVKGVENASEIAGDKLKSIEISYFDPVSYTHLTLPTKA